MFSPNSLLYKHLFAIVLCFALSFVYVNAQFPQTINLDSRNPSVVQSNATEVGKQYIITIEGTYSMWQSYNGYGVDAAYLYDVPQEEIDNLRWPPKEIFGQKLYELPMWFGTDNEIPPFDIPGLNIKIVSRDHIGLRINGNWLPNTGYKPASHTYQLRMIGNGKPVDFQILDSSFNVSQMRVVSMHEDNSGELIVKIEEEPDLNICEFEVICEDNEVVGVRLSAALFQYTDSTSTPKNLLNEINHEMLGMTIDGLFICPDSILCNEPVEGNMAWAMVFDASGSMLDTYGSITKIEALQNSASKFLDKFRQDDEGLLIEFNEVVRLSQDWTTDINLLKNKINNLIPSGRTAYFDAGYEGVSKTYVHNNPHKAIILLSDGEDNESIKTEQQLIDYANEKNIKIFSVAVSLTNEGQSSLKKIADLTGGKYYTANDPDAMDSVFTDIYNDIETDDCCRIYFTIPDSIMKVEKPYKTEIHLLTYDKDGNLIVKKVNIIIPEGCDDIISSVIWEFDDNDDYERNFGVSSVLVPNPSNTKTDLYIDVINDRHLQIDLLNNNGEMIKEINNSVLSHGSHILGIELTDLSAGNYFIRMIVDGQNQITKKLLVVK
jgi:VWFA-related protein